MKGMELLSDLFSLFMLIIVIMLITALIWVFTEIRVVGSTFVKPRQATINIFFNPVRYESAFLTFLELKHKGIPMKKLLNLAVIQNTTNVWVPEIFNPALGTYGDFVNVSTVSRSFFNDILNGKTCLLKIRNPEIIIVDGSGPRYWQKVSMELFSLNGKPVDLELYVG